jgi:hypothetical protein
MKEKEDMITSLYGKKNGKSRFEPKKEERTKPQPK